MIAITQKESDEGKEKIMTMRYMRANMKVKIGKFY